MILQTKSDDLIASKMTEILKHESKLGILSCQIYYNSKLCRLAKRINENYIKENNKVKTKSKCKCSMPNITKCRNKEDDFCKSVIKKACYDYNKPYCWTNCCVWPIKY